MTRLDVINQNKPGQKQIYVVPQESKSIVNPNVERQRVIPQKNLWESPIPRKIRVGAKRK